MPRIPTSLADISTEFPTTQPGVHQVTIDDATMGESKAGKPMLTLEMSTRNEDGQTVRMFEYITFETKDGKVNEAGLRTLKRLVTAWLGEDRADDPNFDTDELKGITGDAMLDLVEEEYNGETSMRNRVKRYLPR